MSLATWPAELLDFNQSAFGLISRILMKRLRQVKLELQQRNHNPLFFLGDHGRLDC